MIILHGWHKWGQKIGALFKHRCILKKYLRVDLSPKQLLSTFHGCISAIYQRVFLTIFLTAYNLHMLGELISSCTSHFGLTSLNSQLFPFYFRREHWRLPLSDRLRVLTFGQRKNHPIIWRKVNRTKILRPAILPLTIRSDSHVWYARNLAFLNFTFALKYLLGT